MENNPLHEIIIRTCTDRFFREAFLKDPVTVLQKASIQIPDNTTVKVLQNSDEQIYIVLPTSVKDQPMDRPPTPGEAFESAGLVMKWTASGVSLRGRISSESAPKLKQQLDRATETLLIDFAEVSFMSSAGLGVLLATKKRLASKQKEMYLCNVAAPIKNIFSLSALDSFFNFVNTVNHTV